MPLYCKVVTVGASPLVPTCKALNGKLGGPVGSWPTNPTAELGFACLVVETVQLGEVRGYHHGCYREGWFHWISRGYSSAHIEAINGIRGLDLLAQRHESRLDRN